MAGWTQNRLAKRRQASLPGGDGSGGSPAQAHPDRQLSFDADWPRQSSPHLVASNSPQDLQLSRVVELEIIPRLMLMHSGQPLRERLPLPVLVLTDEHVHTLARLSAEGDADSAGSYVRALLDAGASQDQVFLDLLAPCARWLGQLWEEDRYNFSQVTIALWRLQQVLHEQGSRFNSLSRPASDSHRALLAAVPGAQHTFGVVMAAEFFSRAGWDVECEPKPSWPELQARLSGSWFDMFGLSISTGDSIPRVASAILDMREASANPLIFVMVGGPMAALMPDLAALCGADAMASDARSAVEQANCGVGRIVKQA